MLSFFNKAYPNSNYIRWNWSTHAKDIGTVYLLVGILIYLIGHKNLYSLFLTGIIFLFTSLSLVMLVVSIKKYYKNSYWLFIFIGSWFIWPIFILIYNLVLLFVFHDFKIISENTMLAISGNNGNNNFTTKETFEVKFNPTLVPLSAVAVTAVTVYVTKKPVVSLATGTSLTLTSMAYIQGHGYATAYRARQQAEQQRLLEQQRHDNDMKLVELKHQHQMELFKYNREFKNSLNQQDELTLRKKYNLPINHLDSNKSSNNDNLEIENISLDYNSFNDNLTLFICQTYNNTVITLLSINVLLLICLITILISYYIENYRTIIVSYLNDKNWVNLKNFVEFQFKISSLNRWILIILVFILVITSLLLLIWMYLVPLPTVSK